MKTILLLIILLMIVNCFNLFGQLTIKNQTTLDDSLIKKIVHIACTELSIDSCFIIIASKKFNENILIRGDFGACEMIRKGYYLINIEENLKPKLLSKLLFHELTHVKQYHVDELRIIGNNRGIYYKNKAYNLHYLSITDYRFYEWEKPAKRNEIDFYKKYKSIIKSF